MAGTTFFADKGELYSDRASPNLYVQMATSLRAIVTDLDVLRTGLDIAEGWILEIDTDSDTINRGTATFDAADTADGAGETADVTVTSAALGDFCLGGLSVDLQGMLMTHTIDATSSGQSRIGNETAGANINLASATLTHISVPRADSAIVNAVAHAVMSATAFDAASDMTAFNITIS